jgi:hypothetical protein
MIEHFSNEMYTKYTFELGICRARLYRRPPSFNLRYTYLYIAQVHMDLLLTSIDFLGLYTAYTYSPGRFLQPYVVSDFGRVIWFLLPAKQINKIILPVKNKNFVCFLFLL